MTRAPFGSCKGVAIEALTDRDLLWFYGMADLQPWLRQAIDAEYRRRDVPPIEVVLDKLRCVRPNASGGYMACCPAHDDRRPSLWVTVRADGVVGIHCHGCCRTPDVLKALGLSFNQLYPLSRRR